MTGLFGALDVSASALTASRTQMDVTAENLANAQTTRTAEGGPYRRKSVVLESADVGNRFGDALSGAMQRGGLSAAASGAVGGSGSAGGPGAEGVQVAGIVEHDAPPRLVYDPGHPDANAEGYVAMPAVDSVTEMVDLIASSRAYEANVTAMQTAKQMYARSLDLLR
ncbi:flagellar basal body rod protein FlgC [Patulibacter minatonensis]|uniref:flagellar basal body rod protein FlgC n=1 Tax=Patulibacter minatonensis TaxID=298163 RepID=UPI00047AB418|nr:flagellar basal body rod protein FlgC [Patulibacter minatonensis]